METTIDLQTRVRELLFDSKEDLPAVVRCMVWRMCDATTRELIGQSEVGFFRVPESGGQWRFVLCIQFEQHVIKGDDWLSLSLAIDRFQRITGINEVYIRDPKTAYKGELVDNKWQMSLVNDAT